MGLAHSTRLFYGIHPKVTREKLADEAMRKFKEVFGHYPRTVASWLLDTHTICYLAEHYDISAFAICSDQVSTDAYTLIGRSLIERIILPKPIYLHLPRQRKCTFLCLFSIFGPCPLHNYEAKKYLWRRKRKGGGCYTLSRLGNRTYAGVRGQFFSNIF